MKELSFEMMEEVQGGNFAESCTRGIFAGWAVGGIQYASMFGPWGTVAGLAGSCLVGVLLT